jgi:hypothetical protein
VACHRRFFIVRLGCEAGFGQPGGTGRQKAGRASLFAGSGNYLGRFGAQNGYGQGFLCQLSLSLNCRLVLCETGRVFIGD